MAVSSTRAEAGHARFRICRRGSVPSFVDMNAARTYEIRTYGCQMNFHDSERLAGLLEGSGYQRAPGGEVPDVVVFNTCAVRENADNRLYGNLGHLMPEGGAPGHADRRRRVRGRSAGWGGCAGARRVPRAQAGGGAVAGGGAGSGAGRIVRGGGLWGL